MLLMRFPPSCSGRRRWLERGFCHRAACTTAPYYSYSSHRDEEPNRYRHPDFRWRANSVQEPSAASRPDLDDSDLFITWFGGIEMLDEQQQEPPPSPRRPRGPRAPPSTARIRGRHSIYSIGHNPPWAFLPSPLQQLEKISPESFHAAFEILLPPVPSTPPPIPAKSSRRTSRTMTMSSSSVGARTSVSTLMSDLDQSIESWSSVSSLQTLRKKRSPKHESLRDIRTMHSEAQLQAVYDLSTLAYLDDSLFDDSKPPSPLRTRRMFSV